jgi:hypothetical protein
MKHLRMKVSMLASRDVLRRLHFHCTASFTPSPPPSSKIAPPCCNPIFLVGMLASLLHLLASYFV